MNKGGLLWHSCRCHRQSSAQLSSAGCSRQSPGLGRQLVPAPLQGACEAPSAAALPTVDPPASANSRPGAGGLLQRQQTHLPFQHRARARRYRPSSTPGCAAWRAAVAAPGDRSRWPGRTPPGPWRAGYDPALGLAEPPVTLGKTPRLQAAAAPAGACRPPPTAYTDLLGLRTAVGGAEHHIAPGGAVQRGQPVHQLGLGLGLLHSGHAFARGQGCCRRAHALARGCGSAGLVAQRQAGSLEHQRHRVLALAAHGAVAHAAPVVHLAIGHHRQGDGHFIRQVLRALHQGLYAPAFVQRLNVRLAHHALGQQGLADASRGRPRTERARSRGQTRRCQALQVKLASSA